jgi:hypothetical protein
MLLFFIPRYPPQSRLILPFSAMEIKFELDADKAARATVAIVASYGLEQVSEYTEYPQLAFDSLQHPPCCSQENYSSVIYLPTFLVRENIPNSPSL